MYKRQQQQRVALARSLAYEPEALLFDEPFSAMDTYLREGLRLELADALKDYDGVTIMVTHDRDEAYQLCDNLLLMDRGCVLAAGRTRDIFQNPVTCRAARLTGCKNISRIERLGERRIRAVDWDCLLYTSECFMRMMRQRFSATCAKGSIWSVPRQRKERLS